MWCADPFYCNSNNNSRPPAEVLGEPPAAPERGGGFGFGCSGPTSHQETSLPTEDGVGGAVGCRLQVVGGGRVHFVSAEAVDFLQSFRERTGPLDRVLMKEMVQLVGDYGALGRGLRGALRPGTGMALIAGRTPSDTIPWFPRVFYGSSRLAGRAGVRDCGYPGRWPRRTIVPATALAADCRHDVLSDVVVAARVQVDAVAVQEGQEGRAERRRLFGGAVVAGAEEEMVADNDL